MRSEVNSVLEMIGRGELDSAKARLQSLQHELKSERDRGSLLAASGICGSIMRAKEGTMQSWEPTRLERAAKSIVASQFADDFDQGYAEAMQAYSKLTQRTV